MSLLFSPFSSKEGLRYTERNIIIIVTHRVEKTTKAISWLTLSQYNQFRLLIYCFVRWNIGTTWCSQKSAGFLVDTDGLLEYRPFAHITCKLKKHLVERCSHTSLSLSL
jgi:hypothetical protein